MSFSLSPSRPSHRVHTTETPAGPATETLIATLVDNELAHALSHLQQLTGGDTHLGEQLLERFIDSVGADLVGLSLEGDAAATPRINIERLHRMVGAFLGLGAQQLAERCRALQSHLDHESAADPHLRRDTERAVALFLDRLRLAAHRLRP